MDLREYISALAKRWYLVAILALLGGALAFQHAHSTPPQYRATSQVFVSLSHAQSAQELAQGSDFTQNLVQSYAQLATMPVVLQPVIDKLHLDVTPKTLAKSVSSATPLDTVIIQIGSTSTSPQRAADVANAVADQLSTTISDLSPASSAGDTVRVKVVAPAEVPRLPFAPRTKFTTALGLALGLIVGVLVALVRALMDTRVRDADDIALVTDAALLGSIPILRGRMKKGAVTATAPRSVASETYRRLQTNLQFLDASAPLQTIVVTSSLGGEGKSTTSINLALAIAEKDRRVLLVDADMRRPAIADYCNMEGAAGLTTILIGKAKLEEVVQPWSQPALHVLPLGEVPPNPSQLIGSPPMEALLRQVREEYDFVILDSPPLLPVADGAILSRLSDGAVVVANCKKVHRQQLSEALETLEAVDARCLGLVANQVRGGSERTHYYGNLRGMRPRLRQVLRDRLADLLRTRGRRHASTSAAHLG